MAEDLADGEFWLPSHFLTDDDILMDLDLDFSSTTHGGSSSSISDLDFTSVFTETESDEDDIILAGLTHQMSRSSIRDSSCPVHSKVCGLLSSSPQSTLFGCVCNQSSSRESASPPQVPPHAEIDFNKNDSNTATNTLDLLNKAAGEVARLKMTTEKKVGTGFFDCSQKGVSYPQPIKNLEHFSPIYFQPQFHHFPLHMVWPHTTPNVVQYNQPKQQQTQPPSQNKTTKSDNKKNSNNNNNNNNNRPLGLPPSAWPPLQAQPPAQAQAQSKAQRQTLPPVIVGPPKGTGVFLPRCVAIPVNKTRKKTDGNTTKSKSGKGLQSQLNHRRNSSKTTTTANHTDIQLPQEWTY